jgi:hypothetical protein
VQAKPANAFDISAHIRPKDVEVWPENWQSFCLFAKVNTQWRVGMNGPTGLDYCAIYPLIDKIAEDAEDWNQIFDDIQVMESEAIDVINSRNK